MATSALSLPIDVPWKRLAISQDMYATSIDAPMPERWKSSLAVMYYEPDPDPTDTSGEVTTFLKFVTSITGYNYDRTFTVVDPKHHISHRVSLAGTYYPAFCAIAQIAVFPDSGTWTVEQFPYYTDFQPKQREVIETQTATGEIVSHTTDPLNVTKSTTTTEGQQTSESADGSTTIGKTGNATETLFTDASREKRETTSYSTNLSQLYQILDSYHSGTNRAMFLTTPRPHLVDSVYTFVNGPRRLEGIQEFFLVVRRPKEMAGICVRAELETAHLDPSDTSDSSATLFTTARAVSGCTAGGQTHILPQGQWVVFEKQLSQSVNDLLAAAAQSGIVAVASANALSRSLRDMVIGSFQEGARYPLGQVEFLHTNFAMRKLVGSLPAELLHAQPDVLDAVRKVEAALNTQATKLSTHDLTLRRDLLRAVGIGPQAPDKA